MKKTLIVTVLFAVLCTAHAQENATTKTHTFGIKAGPNFSTLSVKYEDESESLDWKTGVHAGVFARFSMMHGLAFQPELLFSTEGSRDEEDGEKLTLRLHYIHLPLMLQLDTKSGFYAEIGPGLGYLITAKTKWEIDGEEEIEDVKDDMEKLNLTGNVGFGYAMQNGFGAGVRYMHGFSNGIKNPEDSERMRTRTFQLSLFKRF
ncbi:MAG: porin family protein [Chitinophagaceae bacterium]